MQDIISLTDTVCLSFTKNAKGFHFLKQKLYSTVTHS